MTRRPAGTVSLRLQKDMIKRKVGIQQKQERETNTERFLCAVYAADTLIYGRFGTIFIDNTVFFKDYGIF